MEMKRDYWSTTLLTQSGKAVIDRREVAALVVETLPMYSNLNIHLKSGTIFTVEELLPKQLKDMLNELKLIKSPQDDKEFGSYIGYKKSLYQSS